MSKCSSPEPRYLRELRVRSPEALCSGYTLASVFKYTPHCVAILQTDTGSLRIQITNASAPATASNYAVEWSVGISSSTSFAFQTTGTGYNGFSLSGGQTDTQNLNAGDYKVKELVPLGWVLTGIGGSTDCVVGITAIFLIAGIA
jgi:hypothetical protein